MASIGGFPVTGLGVDAGFQAFGSVFDRIQKGRQQEEENNIAKLLVKQKADAEAKEFGLKQQKFGLEQEKAESEISKNKAIRENNEIDSFNKLSASIVKGMQTGQFSPGTESAAKDLMVKHAARIGIRLPVAATDSVEDINLKIKKSFTDSLLSDDGLLKRALNDPTVDNVAMATSRMGLMEPVLGKDFINPMRTQLNAARQAREQEESKGILTPQIKGSQVVTQTPDGGFQAKDIKNFHQEEKEKAGNIATPTDVDDADKLLIKQFKFNNGREPNANELVDIRQKAINMNRKMTSVLDTFEQKEGKAIAQNMVESAAEARTAVKNVVVISAGLDLLDKGVFTGTGANIQTEFAKAINKFGGLRVGGEKVANTETFAGLMGVRVGQIIKLFGSGTGLSDADREFATKIAGGNINVNEQAIRQLLTIGNKLEVFDVMQYNQKLEDFNNARVAQGRSKSLQRPIDIKKMLPTGKGKNIDELVSSIFLTATGGNPREAEKLAKAKGWKF